MKIQPQWFVTPGKQTNKQTRQATNWCRSVAIHTGRWEKYRVMF
jgi:hypothetical protein